MTSSTSEQLVDSSTTDLQPQIQQFPLIFETANGNINEIWNKFSSQIEQMTQSYKSSVNPKAFFQENTLQAQIKILPIEISLSFLIYSIKNPLTTRFFKALLNAIKVSLIDDGKKESCQKALQQLQKEELETAVELTCIERLYEAFNTLQILPNFATFFLSLVKNCKDSEKEKARVKIAFFQKEPALLYYLNNRKLSPLPTTALFFIGFALVTNDWLDLFDELSTLILKFFKENFLRSYQEQLFFEFLHYETLPQFKKFSIHIKSRFEEMEKPSCQKMLLEKFLQLIYRSCPHMQNPSTIQLVQDCLAIIKFLYKKKFNSTFSPPIIQEVCGKIDEKEPLNLPFFKKYKANTLLKTNDSFQNYTANFCQLFGIQVDF